MKKEKKISVKKIPYLDYACKVGERVQWNNIQGEHFEGTLIAWEDNLALVRCNNGKEYTIKC
jgi:hypothetical protein